MLGTLLGPGIVLMALTGLISQWNYYPSLGRNATTPTNIPALFTLPTGWPWSYAVNQGVHVTLGFMLIPLLLAKLWSVVPRLFSWPAVRSPAHAIERLSILTLVASVLVEFVTGVLDAEYWYPWHFSFYLVHYYGAWVFFSAFVVHVTVKLPTVRRAYRTQGVLKPLRDDLAHTKSEPRHPLVARQPAAATITRRGLLATLGGASLAIFVVQAGESIGGPLRSVALLAARGRGFGTGPNDFQITTTAATAQITPDMTGAAWRLRLFRPDGTVASFTREELLALPQHEAELPIACVEGWSTTQHWSGVRLAELRRLAGAGADAIAEVQSIQPEGPFRRIALGANQVATGDALLALRVNGVDLSPDHGYPARVIIPGAPGVHNTKWVGDISFT
jgi:DMSO/TMAO reductase YedYZ molybdopterin-dependent catalytic subunit